MSETVLMVDARQLLLQHCVLRPVQGQGPGAIRGGGRSGCVTESVESSGR